MFTSVSGDSEAGEEVVLTVHEHVDLRSVQVVVGGVQASELADIAHDCGTLSDHGVVVNAESGDLAESQLAVDFQVVELVRVHAEVLQRHASIGTRKADRLTLSGDVKVVELQLGLGLLSLGGGCWRKMKRQVAVQIEHFRCA